MTREQQVEVLRKLVKHVERGKPLPAEMAKALAQELEDRNDAELAEKRRRERLWTREELRVRYGT